MGLATIAYLGIYLEIKEFIKGLDGKLTTDLYDSKTVEKLKPVYE